MASLRLRGRRGIPPHPGPTMRRRTRSSAGPIRARLGKVEFPIVDNPDKWEGVVKRKVRGAWPAAVAELRAVQQFAPPAPDPPSPLPAVGPLLSRLRILGGTDKHRNLALFVTGAWSASVKGPQPKPWYSTQIRIYVPGPLLPVEPGQKVEVWETPTTQPFWALAPSVCVFPTSPTNDTQQMLFGLAGLCEPRHDRLLRRRG
jgi:hypothetical protein